MEHMRKILIEEMMAKADFRRRKAEEYPHDAMRNLECASEFDKMALWLGQYRGGPAFAEFVAIYESQDPRLEGLTELQMAVSASIYFAAEHPEDYFRRLVDEVSITR